jgi:hypothetical protein
VFQYVHTKVNRDFVLITLLLVLVFTSSVLPSVIVNADQSFFSSRVSDSINGKVFDALYSNSTVESTSGNGNNHNVVLEEAMLQDGKPHIKWLSTSLAMDRWKLTKLHFTITTPQFLGLQLS